MSERQDGLIKRIFDQAFDRSGAERAVYLDRACTGVPDLRGRVEALLEAAEKNDRFLADPTLPVIKPVATTAAVEHPGSRIGPYTLVELIGEGGFGSVFRAEQSAPVRRQVALKIIKAGMDTRQVIARFEAERQALALMDHPSIARVLEAGATDSGRPYFVMELVRGEPVTRFCDRQRLSVTQRLELFCGICAAVQHAHQKGIIHRDLKPSNILVTNTDGPPLAKVIDFGIAKATAARLTDQTITGFHQLVGTPEYMSPEQAENLAGDIDTRSDIYSLGVLLYEMLTGTTPFNRQRLAASGLDGMRRIMRDEQPVRPSLRLKAMPGSSAGGRLPSRSPDPAPSAIEVAIQRRTEPTVLARTLRHDLDWIVLKCLEKERARRYDTASALREDIERYLHNQPVLATPPSLIYRLRKFTQRNRAGVIGAAAVAATLIIAAGVSIGFGIREARHRALADEAREQARQRADDLEQIVRFQENQLTHIDPQAMGVRLRASLIESLRALGERTKLAPNELDARVDEFERLIAGGDFTGVAVQALHDHVFQAALTAMEEPFEDRPLIKARLLQAVASALIELGAYDAAAAPQTEALAIRGSRLGEEHPETLASLHQKGTLLHAQGQLAEAEDTFRAVLEASRRVLGNEHPETLNSLNSLARVLWMRGNMEEAESCYRDALAKRRRVLGDEHRDTIITLGKAGGLLRARGKLAEAEGYCREAMESSRRVLGEEHRDTRTAIGAMASLLRAQGRLAEAEPLYREALEKSRRALGDEHSNTITLIGNLGGLLLAQRRLDEAEVLVRESLALRRRILGDEHPDTLNSIINMGALLWTRNDLPAAEPYFFEAVDKSRRVLGPNHPDTLTAINNMGILLRTEGKLGDAEPYFREALEQSRRVLGNEHPDTLISVLNMGSLLQSLDNPAGALELLAPAEPAARRVFTGGHAVHFGRFLTALGRVRLATGDFAQAERDLMEAHAVFEGPDGSTDRDRDSVCDAFEKLYTEWHAADPGQGHDITAAEWRARLTDRRTPTGEPSDPPR